MGTPSPVPSDLTRALLEEASWVRDLAQRLARDQAAAEDVSQEALALALERRPEVRASLRPWLARVATRLVRRRERSERRRAEHERAKALEPTTGEEDERLLERLELQERLAQHVRALPEPYRRLILSRYYEGRSAADIARDSGASAATVRSQIARGLERLRREFERETRTQEEERWSGVLPALLLAAGANPSQLAQGGMIVKTSSKLVAAVGALGALGVLGATYWVARPQGPSAAATEDAGMALSEGYETTGSSGEVTEVVAVKPKADPATSSTRRQAAAAQPPTLEVHAPTTVVLARLLESAGVPIPGAELRSIHVDGSPRGEDSFGSADNQGRVRLGLPDRFVRRMGSGVYERIFQATAPMHATLFVGATPELHGTTDLGELVLPPGGAVRGLVVDEGGVPIEGATLYLSRGYPGPLEDLRLAGPEPGVRRPRTSSLGDGRFEFPGAALGTVRVLAGKEGRLWAVSEELLVEAERWTEVGSLVLEELALEEIIEGLVAQPGGEPAPGAQVSFHTTDTGEQGVLFADDAGRFRFHPGGPQEVDFIARDPGGDASMSATRRASRGVHDLLLELTVKRSLALLVLDAQSGEPVEGARAMPRLATGFEWEEAGRPILGEGWTLSGADGRLELDLPPADLRLYLRHPSYESQSLGPWKSDESPTELTVPLEPQPRIEGRVLSYGEPVEGAAIAVAKRGSFVAVQAGFPQRFLWSEDLGVRTDAEGRFSGPVHSEWSAVYVLARKPGLARGEAYVELEPGRGASGIEIALTRGGAVTGRVAVPNDRPLGGVVVAASCGDGEPHVTRTDERGEYRLEGLRPGSWRVEPRESEPSRELLSFGGEDGGGDFRWNLEVVDGETQVLDLDARDLFGRELSGRLTVGGKPAAGFTAELLPTAFELTSEDRPPLKLDEQGRFSLRLTTEARPVAFRGTLETGEEIEIVRELALASEGGAWQHDVPLGRVDTVVEVGGERLRLHHGSSEWSLADRGERVSVFVRADAEGRVRSPAPTGTVWLQRRRVVDSRALWVTVQTLEVTAP